MQKINKRLIGRYDWAVFSGLFVNGFFLQMLPIILLAVSIDLGFSLKEGGFAKGGLIQVFSGIAGVIAILSCSFLASQYGKRATYTASFVIFIVGIISLSMANSYMIYVLGTMLTGAGGGIIIGVAPAIAHDLHPEDSGKYLTIANSFWSAGMLLTVLLSGYLLSKGISWEYIVLLSGSAVLVPVIIMIFPSNNGQKFPGNHEKSSLVDVIRTKKLILKNGVFWKFVALISLTIGGEMSIEVWLPSYVQLNYGATAEAGGFTIGCFAVGMIISRFLCGCFVNQAKIKNFIMVFASASFVATMSVPFIESLEVLYVVMFLTGCSAAPLWPCVQSYSVDQLPEFDKTAVLILLTVSGIFSFSVFSWLSGLIASHYDSLTPVFYIVPLNYVFFILILLVKKKRPHPVLKSLR